MLLLWISAYEWRTRTYGQVHHFILNCMSHLVKLKHIVHLSSLASLFRFLYLLQCLTHNFLNAYNLNRTKHTINCVYFLVTLKIIYRNGVAMSQSAHLLKVVFCFLSLSLSLSSATHCFGAWFYFFSVEAPNVLATHTHRERMENHFRKWFHYFKTRI